MEIVPRLTRPESCRVLSRGSGRSDGTLGTLGLPARHRLERAQRHSLGDSSAPHCQNTVRVAGVLGSLLGEHIPRNPLRDHVERESDSRYFRRAEPRLAGVRLQEPVRARSAGGPGPTFSLDSVYAHTPDTQLPNKASKSHSQLT